MVFFETQLCVQCKGRGFCGNSCKIYNKINNFAPKTRKHFSGNSPPEVFVGKFDYPNINAGILSPDNYSESSTEDLALPENWHNKNFSINKILTNRSQLIYGRFKTQIKATKINNKFTNLMQEISMAHKSVSTEFFLKKTPRKNLEISKSSPIITNPAPLKHARLQENPKVKPKVDYLISDTNCKSVNSINELYNYKIPVSNIIKILSVGLLGLKTQRRLVPTRWAITATDDTISKQMLKKIKYYPEINEILLFHAYYVGNHYEILILPDKFSFEVIEAYMCGSVWNPHTNQANFSQDYEGFFNRKYYAKNVTGAYYVARLALCEYLEKIKKQATVFIIREERPEYYVPLGVGILRQTCRHAFQQKPEKFDTVEQALNQAQKRLKLPISEFTNRSAILKEFGKQKKLTNWF